MRSVFKTGNDRVRKKEDPPPKGRESLVARLSVVVLMVMVLLGAGALSAMTAMRFAIRGQEVVVPDLGGMVQADAAGMLTESELGLEVAGRRFSDTVPEGGILDQTPPAGTRVKRNRNIRVLLSLGERQFAVPDVRGSSLRSAQIMLGQRGLSLGSTLYSHTVEDDASTIVYQKPEAGDVGNSDPDVAVLVSLGPIERYFVMPDLTGQGAAGLVGRIRAEGFRVGELTYTRQPGVAAGLVIGQQPPAGYKVSQNDVVLLEVSQ